MRNFLFILLSSFLLLTNVIKAQQLRFKAITSENGLSTNFVHCIMQDDKGFMWFGTQDGLNKYNGFDSKIFKNDPSDTNSLRGSEIFCLSQINTNLILIGTDNGLHFFNPVNEKFQRISKRNKGLLGKITTIYKLDESKALVGTENNLYLVDVNQKSILLSVFNVTEPLNVSCVYKFNNTIFVGTMDKGLWKLDAKYKAQRFWLGDQKGGAKYIPVEFENATSLCEYNQHLYIATYGKGIYILNKDLQLTGTVNFGGFNENSNFITDFTIKNNRIYAATEYGLVLQDLDSERFLYFHKTDKPFSLSSNGCTSVFLDAEKNCWVGTQLSGVNVAFSRALKFPISNFNLESEFANVFSFCETKPGFALVGGVKTFHELNLITGEKNDLSKFLSSGTALCILRENENIYWVGTWGNGLFRYDKATNSAKNILDIKLGGTIVYLHLNGDKLYAGSVGDGLFRINTSNFETTRFTEKDGLPDPSVNYIFKDSKDNVWLGTYEGGLVKMSGYDANNKLPITQVYKNTGLPSQLASNIVLAINEDKNGNIWLATSTGLSKLKPDGSFYNFYEKDGLSNAYLYSLLKDSTGNFWMTSNSGIIRFNPELPEKEIEFKNYSIKDGLINPEYSMGAACSSNSGKIYVGGTKGFNVFSPSQIKDNLNAPASYVVGYKRGGKDVPTDSLIIYKKHLQLSWSENFFQFELAALDYTDPGKNKFMYMLEGYDNDWSTPTTVRYVSYTELPGGDYTFKVKATNSDGTWNETPYQITITVVPPFWKTKTFYVLIIVIGLGSVIGYTQYRTRAIKKVNKILEAKVEERTKELHEKNLDITASIQYAKRIQEAILPAKDQIYSKMGKIFILYRPKDIVSGDFYWFAEKNGVKIFAVVDCTGHGVPGAFMSMIGHNLLNQIVLENGITDPADILNHLHRGIQAALRQGHNVISTNDGMDVSMITINSATAQVQWAGANRPLVLLSPEGEFSRLEGDKFPVGGAQAHVDRMFTCKAVEAKKGSMAYMFSDGYADQFGGEKGKKFMVKRLHETLVAIHQQPAGEQQNELEKQFLEWKKEHEQVDDVLVVGIGI
ncbi:MAG: SpoIIE family protein phosphatase [Bacteroidia bacterium]|nr:SpoIIE family protein phosphatase [Bacteroidia bacterium]